MFVLSRLLKQPENVVGLLLSTAAVSVCPVVKVIDGEHGAAYAARVNKPKKVTTDKRRIRSVTLLMR
jgi:hypothetical protein